MVYDERVGEGVDVGAPEPVTTAGPSLCDWYHDLPPVDVLLEEAEATL